MSRPSCLQCARKHVGEAEVLMREAVMGYPLHAYLAVGHLSQAEAELLDEYPDMAHIVRAERVNYIEGLKYKTLKDKDEVEDEIREYLALDVNYKIQTLDLISQITMIEIGNTKNTQAIT
jgi:hypothetical protein